MIKKLDNIIQKLEHIAEQMPLQAIRTVYDIGYIVRGLEQIRDELNNQENQRHGS